MSVKQFYEEMYDEQPGDSTRRSLLYRVLSRFLVTRYDVVNTLVSGDERYLDIGCGEGEFLSMFSDRFKELYGIDISDTRIERVRQRFADDPRIHLKAIDVNEKIDLPEDYFDTVTAVSVLEHVFDPYHFISECHRLMRQNATLIIQVPNIAWGVHRFRLMLGKLPITSDEEGWDGGHLHYFTVSTLARLFRESGFEVVSVKSSGIFTGFRRLWGTMLAGDIIITGRKK